VTGRTVAVAPGRAKRPGASRPTLEPPTPEELERCPFCAGHEEMTPPQTLVLPEAGDWRVRVVPNLYPALERQEVVVHSRRHVRSIAELDDVEIGLVAEAWRRRCEAERRGYLHALINEGREAGSSLPHSHSQLAWLPAPPPPEPQLDGDAVLEEDGVRVWSPRLARTAYELAIAPVEPEQDGLHSPRLATALRLLVEVVRRLRAIEGAVPLNAWLHDAGEWRLVLFPRLSILAGLELGAGVYVNTLPPDEAAERLRDAEGRPEAASAS
jgi:UDPglucose--hexose-1-phosphate uridylyltransferase